MDSLHLSKKLENLENLVKDLTKEKLRTENQENEIRRANMSKKHTDSTLELVNKYAGKTIDDKIRKAVDGALTTQNQRFEDLQMDYEKKSNLIDVYDRKLESLQSSKLALSEENHKLKLVINEYELESSNLKNLVKNMEGELDIVDELRAENGELV
jgi:phage tail tube protein FII